MNFLANAQNTHKEERVKKAILEIPSPRYYAPDLFVEWIISKDFDVDSFRDLVDWIDDDKIDRLSDFWRGYDAEYDRFANDWVSEKEREEFINFCSEW